MGGNDVDRGKRRALLSVMAVATSLALSIGSVTAQDDDEAMESAAPDASAAPMAPLAPMPSIDPAALGPGLHVVGAWSRESPMMELAGAAFMVIVNNTETDDALVSASSPAATTVEIHQTTQAEDGTMTMAPVEEVPIPAGGMAELKPGSYHIMLIDLVAPLVVGEQIEVTLTFATAEPQTVMVPVQALGPMAAPTDDDEDTEGMEAQESEGPDDEE
jgi:periplasmic copper chaperone A